MEGIGGMRVVCLPLFTVLLIGHTDCWSGDFEIVIYLDFYIFLFSND